MWLEKLAFIEYLFLCQLQDLRSISSAPAVSLEWDRQILECIPHRDKTFRSGDRCRVGWRHSKTMSPRSRPSLAAAF